jgi:hypothetical protein
MICCLKWCVAASAWLGVSHVLLGHEVAHRQRRPQFPEGSPFDFQLLACRWVAVKVFHIASNVACYNNCHYVFCRMIWMSGTIR